jgi:hypothetical protein
MSTDDSYRRLLPDVLRNTPGLEITGIDLHLTIRLPGRPLHVGAAGVEVRQLPSAPRIGIPAKGRAPGVSKSVPVSPGLPARHFDYGTDYARYLLTQNPSATDHEIIALVAKGKRTTMTPKMIRELRDQLNLPPDQSYTARRRRSER